MASIRTPNLRVSITRSTSRPRRPPIQLHGRLLKKFRNASLSDALKRNTMMSQQFCSSPSSFQKAVDHDLITDVEFPSMVYVSSKHFLFKLSFIGCRDLLPPFVGGPRDTGPTSHGWLGFDVKRFSSLAEKGTPPPSYIQTTPLGYFHTPQGCYCVVVSRPWSGCRSDCTSGANALGLGSRPPGREKQINGSDFLTGGRTRLCVSGCLCLTTGPIKATRAGQTLMEVWLRVRPEVPATAEVGGG